MLAHRIVFISVLSLAMFCYLFGAHQAIAQSNVSTPNDQPPDLTHYVSIPTAEDYAHPARLMPAVFPFFLSELVVDNTNANLTNTDTFGDTEPSIAINPTAACLADATKCEVVVTSFSGEWYTPTAVNNNAPLWHSTNGGALWTKEFKIPPPNQIAMANIMGCPCDQTVHYTRGGLMGGSFLAVNFSNIYTGTTLNPAVLANWHWDVNNAVPPVAQPTNQVSQGGMVIDQPWLMSAPAIGGLDVWDANYDDYAGPNARVAAAAATDPPNFTAANQDRPSGTLKFNCTNNYCANPGTRIAPDTTTFLGLGSGKLYNLYQQDDGANADMSALKITYLLNASTDFGKSWRLTGDLAVPNGRCTVDNTNAATPGCIIAKTESRQGLRDDFKFGGVNKLIGGVDAIAVDPVDGDIYVVYGGRVRDNDGKTRDHLFIDLFHFAGGNLTRIGKPTDLTPGVVAALPAVAVAANHTVAVMYDVCIFENKCFPTDNNCGNNAPNRPSFTTHLAQSRDFGTSFLDQPLVTFLSPRYRCDADGGGKQRVLGDYQQLKAVGSIFFGAFPANGTAFDRTLSNIDPVFVRSPAIQ